MSAFDSLEFIFQDTIENPLGPPWSLKGNQVSIIKVYYVDIPYVGNDAFFYLHLKCQL